MSAAIKHPETEFDLGAAPMRIGRVRLKVRDLAGVSGFYQDVLGLVPVGQSAGRVVLGVSGKPLLELVGDPGLAPLDRREAGLFHTAFLLPDRASLARWLGFVAQRRIRLLGASDHRVSEAIYLADPEGNGIEVYADRPVAAALRQAFLQADHDAASQTWRQVADQLRARWPKLAALMDESEHDVLAYLAFPAQHRTKLHSTNPLERLNKEVKRRADVVGIFPDERSIVRLIGAVLLEQNDEWQLQHRYLQLEAMAELTRPSAEPDPLALPPKAA